MMMQRIDHVEQFSTTLSTEVLVLSTSPFVLVLLTGSSY